ncbi:flagellar basal body rod protein [Mesobacillus harenae]|uniref:lmo0954 family membrane protein n=1 Tax=Mesobacillus harenae TaxID=2213203 RepID=UPI00157FC525|nr:flagellar basal body rod protein [Mesobacillus harenae]
MKKSGLLLIGGLAVMVLIANLGPIVGLAISLVILYFAAKQFLKASSLWGKIGWGAAGLIVLLATASNIPAVLGIAAAYVLYLVYKKWNENEKVLDKQAETDPFVNFEKQWSELNNH